MKSYTKEDVKFLITNWDSMATEDLAAHLGVKPPSIYQIAKLIREAGYPLTKKNSAKRTVDVIADALKDLGIKS